MTFHSAVALTLSLCLFPSSESTTFILRLQDVLSSLVSATKEHRQRLQQDVTAPNFSPSLIIAAVSKAEGALALLASAAHQQKFDVIYSRFAPTDYTQLHTLTRGLIAKASGMTVYYTIIDPTRERFPMTPAPSIPGTPTLASPLRSRPSSPGHDSNTKNVDGHGHLDDGLKHPSHSISQVHHRASHHHKRQRSPHRHHASHHSTHSHGSLLHFALSRTIKTEPAVGVFESLNYLNLEAIHLSHPDSQMFVARANELLSNSCQDLLQSCEQGLQGACGWLGSVRDNRFNFWVSREDKQRIRTDNIKKYEDLHRMLSSHLDEFANKKRYLDIYIRLCECSWL